MRNHSGSILLTLACAFCLPVQAAYGAYSCNISSPGWSVIYDPQAATASTASSSVAISCTRQAGGSGSDPANMSYTLAADHGLSPSGTVNQARLTSGSSLIQYNEYSTSGALWGTGANAISGTLKFGGSASASATVTFNATIPALQNAASGGYSDTVTMTLTYGGTATALAIHWVAVTVNPVCTFSTPPGNITFSYTSFQATAAMASTSFATLCTNTLPYTMSLDTTSGTLLGLAYTLSVPTGTYIGTGAAQTYSLSGSIAAGQAGTCATATCTGTDTHILTITY